MLSFRIQGASSDCTKKAPPHQVDGREAFRIQASKYGLSDFWWLRERCREDETNLKGKEQRRAQLGGCAGFDSPSPSFLSFVRKRKTVLLLNSQWSQAQKGRLLQTMKNKMRAEDGMEGESVAGVSPRPFWQNLVRDLKDQMRKLLGRTIGGAMWHATLWFPPRLDSPLRSTFLPRKKIKGRVI
ncbi:hypothetical protein IE53DRAFT_139459 [Violaceomyces palustris]|uniref:Uncharacterized protein n=1 Tax=Violaceomyces palustris TaxID=1673888 RepID=A0ACD0NUJ5_9BASI|nr:hypothetical protein IE53DRAFT_139459 [Violaceomyces palustris]